MLTSRDLRKAPPPSQAVPVRWRPLERTSGVLFVLLVATLTLEWISLSGFMQGNIKWFHVAALGFIAVELVRYRPSRRLMIVLGRFRVLYGAFALYLVLLFAAGLAHKHPFTPLGQIIRSAFYGGTSVFVAAFFLDIEGRKVRSLLTWTGVATVATVMTAMSTALLSQGVSPIQVIGDAIRTGNPDLISYRLLRASFRSQDLVEAGASLRHKVFSGVLVGLAVGMVCPRRRRGGISAKDLLPYAAAVLGGVLVIGSLSRSVTLCLVLALCIAGVRVILRGRAKPAQVALVGVSIVLLFGVAVSPVGSLLWTRFVSDTGSYQTRVAALGESVVPQTLEAAIIGVEVDPLVTTTSPHNVVLDGLLSAGIPGALATATLLIAYLRVWWGVTRRYLLGGQGWVISLDLFYLMTLGIIPIVRAFTGGQGFHMTDWVCVGVVLGATEANRRTVAALRAQQTTAA
jgi:hypothetical protein